MKIQGQPLVAWSILFVLWGTDFFPARGMDSWDNLKLWYTSPAEKWVEALPIGNGRLGGMVFGRTAQEKVQLNEDTLWAGGPYDPANPDALKALPEARQLVFSGRYMEAHKLISERMMAKPLRQMPYQPLGDLWLSFIGHEKYTHYRRELDLDQAIGRVEYTVEGVRFLREYFSSPVDQVIVIRLSASKPESLSFNIAMTSLHKVEVSPEGQNALALRGVNGAAQGVPGALKFAAQVRVRVEKGTISATGKGLEVRRATSALLLLAAATSYRNWADVSGDPEKTVRTRMAAAAAKTLDAIRRDHLAEHRRLFRRVAFDLGTTEPAKLPTDERIRQFGQNSDPQLVTLHYQFGRYLLISSSRPGTQPANLQGLWNESMTPPWESKYTININTEMNYWLAETANLAECHEPLLQLIRDLSESGRRTAKVQYGARGWVCHHNTDLWRATAPVDGPASGFWPMGGAWLSLHLWDHYEYGGDKQFLAEAYPILKGAALFFLDTLVEDPQKKWLVTCPSNSPENRHIEKTTICAGPTMDLQILRDLFTRCIQASLILGVDPGFRDEVIAVRNRLAPMQIGSAGQLQEWLDDWDLKSAEPHHRHISHLFGLFPSNQIHPRQTPDLTAAARKTLELRGDAGTGWSLAWKINFWARLGEGDRAWNLLSMLLTPERTYPNLFDAHPPFQIDGNFGAASGVMEMLMQSHAGELHLLPSLPKNLPQGNIKGLRARGGYQVDLQWEKHHLTRAGIVASHNGVCRLRVDRAITVTCNGKRVPLKKTAADVYEFPTDSGKTYRVMAAG